MKYRYLIFITLLVAFLNCKKDSSESGGKTRTELITQSSWKYDNAGLDVDKNGSIELSITSQIPSYILDNSLTLYANGTGVIDEGGTKLDASVPQTTPANWSFASNETLLNLGGNGLFGVSGQFKILELSSTQFRLSKDTTIAPFGAVAIVTNLKH